MDDDLHAMLAEQLESGSPEEKDHARLRLSMPDAIGYKPGPRTLRAVPPVVHGDPWRAKILACEYYNPGCCAHPAPFCTRYSINPTREQCVECLGGNS